MNPEVTDYLNSIPGMTHFTKTLSGQWNFPIVGGGIALPQDFFDSKSLEEVKEIMKELKVRDAV